MDSDNSTEEQKTNEMEIIFEQYECSECKKKFYINTEDKQNEEMECPFCKKPSKNIRIFLLEIKGVREY